MLAWKEGANLLGALVWKILSPTDTDLTTGLKGRAGHGRCLSASERRRRFLTKSWNQDPQKGLARCWLSCSLHSSYQSSPAFSSETWCPRVALCRVGCSAPLLCLCAGGPPAQLLQLRGQPALTGCKGAPGGDSGGDSGGDRVPLLWARACTSCTSRGCCSEQHKARFLSRDSPYLSLPCIRPRSRNYQGRVRAFQWVQEMLYNLWKERQKSCSARLVPLALSCVRTTDIFILLFSVTGLKKLLRSVWNEPCLVLT